MNRIRLLPKNILQNIALVLISMYAYSRLSWGYLFPNWGWGIILCTAVGLAFLSNYRSVRLIPHFPDICNLSLMLMLLVSVFWNNADFIHGEWSFEFSFAIIVFFYFFSQNNSEWFNSFRKIVIIVGLFFAFWTLLCLAIPDIYYKNIYPQMLYYKTTYTPGVEAGFTAHYTTNAIYLATGLCSVLGYFFYIKRMSIHNQWLTFSILFLLTLALLVTGKRGVIIFLIIAIVITYFVYRSNQKSGVIIKIFSTTLVVILFIILFSLFIPQVSFFYDRFILQIQSGDISTGRFDLWKVAWDYFLENPLLGKGWNWSLYNIQIDWNTGAHNVFLQWLTEVGILGSIPFFVFMICTYVRALKLYYLACRYRQYYSLGTIINLTIVMLFQSFFIAYFCVGMGFYQVECLYTYIICCSIVQFYWKRTRHQSRNIDEATITL